ncbi:hypothetical protein B0H17DRAFT_985143 [Mycena rosella]|uniref:F-box domain-containing protein n=1 Tax=Mycena rosella TaxID=1033263 RepID=A0AAD7D9S2_MYCRO|nr:hypothetical protein B0H17DRAFT_985143 [Mycena rosella]
MSSARRQSGRLAKQAITPAKAEESTAPKDQGKPKTNQDEESDEDSEDGVESDTSEYGGFCPFMQLPRAVYHIFLGKKRPVKKRQKLNQSTSRTLGRKGKIVDKTCYLTAIPLDVLLEIFVQLEPKALILLARTNRAFRQHLLSKAANSTWKKARENIDGPDCPTDLSEQRWAHLLYGPAKCQSCGAKNIQRVDFGLRRRACTRCLKDNLVVTSSFRKHFPHLEDTILKLIPYTNIGGSAHGHASRNNFYWKPDIEEMADTLAAKERDVHMRLIGARKKLEDFTAERVALVATVVEHAAICRDWLRLLARRREHEESLLCDRRCDAIKDRFMKLGYAEVDLSCISYEASVRQTAQLTDRIWNNIYPGLENLVKASRDRRLKSEHDARIEARVRLVQDIYTAYKKTLVPAQWRFLPGLHKILQLPAFDNIVNAPDDVDVDMSHFKEGRDALPGFLISWPATRKAELVRLMDDARASRPDSSAAQAGTASTVAVSDARRSLDLTTVVFWCKSCAYGQNSLIGWEAAAGHHCCQPVYPRSQVTSVEPNLEFSERGSAGAASLVTLAGLDERHATCSDMDRLDRRFMCLACPRSVPGSKQEYSVFPWRAAVSHFRASHHSAPQWRQLNSVETQWMKTQEPRDPTLSWSCNHCPQYLDNYHTFASVVDHVKTVHSIAKPTAPTDLFRYLDLPRTPSTFFIATAQYHCNRCPPSNNKKHRRTFQLGGVRSHLQAKHKILDPVANKDWVEAKSI